MQLGKFRELLFEKRGRLQLLVDSTALPLEKRNKFKEDIAKEFRVLVTKYDAVIQALATENTGCRYQPNTRQDRDCGHATEESLAGARAQSQQKMQTKTN